MGRFATASEITVGVVGYGGSHNMGRQHLQEMSQAGMTPVAVCETDPDRRRAANTEFPGVSTYESVDEMLANSPVALVVVATPHNTHADLALRCLNAGRHVVVEKPMAVTTEECDRMMEAAVKRGVVLSTYHNRHWDSIILGALPHLSRGAIGDVVRVDVEMAGWGKPRDWWRSSRSISGGVLYDWGVHLLEYTLQVVRSDIVEVSGYSWSGVWADQTAWKSDTVEDEGYLVVRYGGGAWSTLRISSCEERPNPHLFKVLGTRGTMIMNWDETKITTHSGADKVTTRIANPESQCWKFHQNIADHLTRGTELAITPEWARRPIHILDLARRSVELGHALEATYR